MLHNYLSALHNETRCASQRRATACNMLSLDLLYQSLQESIFLRASTSWDLEKLTALCGTDLTTAPFPRASRIKLCVPRALSLKLNKYTDPFWRYTLSCHINDDVRLVDTFQKAALCMQARLMSRYRRYETFSLLGEHKRLHEEVRTFLGFFVSLRFHVAFFTSDDPGKSERTRSLLHQLVA